MDKASDIHVGLKKFYAGKTVLVTGHSGFKGAWLSLWLSRLGARVIGFSLAKADDISRALFQPAIAVAVEGDVRDREAVAALFGGYAPEIVFHLAAQSLVGRSGEDPIGTFSVNVMGAAHVLASACRTPQTRVVVNVTSDKCYANAGTGRAFREDDPLGGKDPYSASKACSEIVTAAWRESLRQGEMPALVTARAGNAIGGGDWAPRRIVPDIVRAIVSDQPVALRNPSAIRPWQHVLDPLRGYLMLAHAAHRAPQQLDGAWNFGPDARQLIEVRELARRLHERWGHGRAIEARDDAGVPEAATLQLDASKARQQLGWRPLIDVGRAIDLTAEWYRGVLKEGADPLRISEAQLAVTEDFFQEETRSPVPVAR